MGRGDRLSDLIEREKLLDWLEGIQKRLDGKKGSLDYLIQRIIMKTENMPVAGTGPLSCDGCKHNDTYDTDFPCPICIRREKDYYEPDE